MKRSASLKRKRDKPRRNEGRVQQRRIRPSPSDQAEYHRDLRDRVRVCEGCKRGGDLVLHHILASFPGKRRRDERYVVILCPACHNMGTYSVHLLGSETRYYDHHGVDLVGIAIARWRLYCQRQGIEP